jgi:hypothetical protein
MVIHSLWITDGRRRVVVSEQEGHASGLVTGIVNAVGSRLDDRPCFVVLRRSGLKRHCQKLTSFAARCQQFCNIPTVELDNLLPEVNGVTNEARDGALRVGLT